MDRVIVALIVVLILIMLVMAAYTIECSRGATVHYEPQT